MHLLWTSIYIHASLHSSTRKETCRAEHGELKRCHVRLAPPALIHPGGWRVTSGYGDVQCPLAGAGLLQGMGMCSASFCKPERTQNMGRDSVCYETHGIRCTTPQDHTGCCAGNRPEAATRSFCRKGCSDEGKRWWMMLDKVDSHGSSEMLADFCYIFKGRGQGTVSGVWERKIRSDLFPDDHSFLIAWKWGGNLTP